MPVLEMKLVTASPNAIDAAHADVLRALFPKGVKPEKYEDALRVARLWVEVARTLGPLNEAAEAWDVIKRIASSGLRSAKARYAESPEGKHAHDLELARKRAAKGRKKAKTAKPPKETVASGAKETTKSTMTEMAREPTIAESIRAARMTMPEANRTADGAEIEAPTTAPKSTTSRKRSHKKKPAQQALPGVDAPEDDEKPGKEVH